MDDDKDLYLTKDNTSVHNIPILSSSEIIVHTFLLPSQEDGQNFRVCIVKMVDDHVSHSMYTRDVLRFNTSVQEWYSEP